MRRLEGDIDAPDPFDLWCLLPQVTLLGMCRVTDRRRWWEARVQVLVGTPLDAVEDIRGRLESVLSVVAIVCCGLGKLNGVNWCRPWMLCQ